MSWFATGPIAIEEKLAVQDILNESRGLSRGEIARARRLDETIDAWLIGIVALA